MRYVVDILGQGSIPIVKMTPGTLCMYLQDEDTSWSRNMSSSSGRFIVPIIEAKIEKFLDRIEETLEKDVIVYIVKRGASLINGVMNLLGGAMIIPLEEEPQKDIEIFEWNRESVRAILSKDFDDYDAFHKIEEDKLESHREAEWRSLRLLGTILNEDQRQSIWDKSKFTMKAHGKTYIIVKNRHGNVYELDDSGEVEASYCICLEEGTLYDQMMAQKLMLELNPEAFFQIANKRHRDDYPDPEPVVSRFQWSFSRMLSDAMALKAIDNEWFSLCGDDPMEGMYRIQMSPR